MRILRFVAAAALAGAAMTAAPASAGLCDLRVFDSRAGVRIAPADQKFAPGEQFIVCVQATADGYVTLWDKMPISAAGAQGSPVERLIPNVKTQRPGENAAPVRAGQEICFGAHDDAEYELFMDAADGVGLGKMWMVFTETDAHPDIDAFSSIDQFADSYRRYGAGAIDGDAQPVEEQDDAGCAPRNVLDYRYVVVE